MERKFDTNYRVAVEWCNNNYVMCNNIPEIDSSIFDNMRFSDYDEETDEYTEIYQWFITDCSEWDVKYLEETFGLLFTYSDLLGCYILCVDHYGTSWDYVYCATSNEYAARELGQRKSDPATYTKKVATEPCPADMQTPQSNY
jgi:hypothetical protein